MIRLCYFIFYCIIFYSVLSKSTVDSRRESRSKEFYQVGFDDDAPYFVWQVGKVRDVTSFPTTALSTIAPMAPPVGMAIFGTRVLASQDSKVRMAMIPSKSVANV